MNTTTTRIHLECGHGGVASAIADHGYCTTCCRHVRTIRAALAARRSAR